MHMHTLEVLAFTNANRILIAIPSQVNSLMDLIDHCGFPRVSGIASSSVTATISSIPQVALLHKKWYNKVEWVQILTPLQN